MRVGGVLAIAALFAALFAAAGVTAQTDAPELATEQQRLVAATRDAARDEADLLFSFGRATWPHLLARAMLAEQLFRATSILANHPYHREG